MRYPRIGRRFQVDPLISTFPNQSSYMTFFNNPIMLVDPTGMGPEWKPNKNGDLEAEEDDNATTLATNYNMNETEAQKLIDDQNLALDKNGNVKVGQVLTLDNAYTRSIKKSNSTAERDGYGGVPDGYDSYNCFSSCIRGMSGEEIRPLNDDDLMMFKSYTSPDDYLRSNAEATDMTDLIFGKTLVRVANSSNVAEHAVVYYGKSKNGTLYAYTKDGPIVKPAITTLNNAVKGYGKIKGLKVEKSFFTNVYEYFTGDISKDTYDSGFYNPK